MRKAHGKQVPFPKNLKLGTITVTRRNFGDFLKSLTSSSTFLPPIQENRNSAKSLKTSKELFKNVFNIKNVSFSAVLSCKAQGEVLPMLQPFLEVEVIIKKLRKYVYNVTNVSVENKKKVILEDWDSLIKVFEKYDMKEYVTYARHVKGDICCAFNFFDQALFEYRKAVLFLSYQIEAVRQGQQLPQTAGGSLQINGALVPPLQTLPQVSRLLQEAAAVRLVAQT